MFVTKANGDHPFLNTMRALKKSVIVKNPLGLHARPAAQLAQTARTAHGPVSIFANDRQVDAKEVLEILSLACGAGSRVIIEVKNLQDLSVLEKILAQLQDDSGETCS